MAFYKKVGYVLLCFLVIATCFVSYVWYSINKDYEEWAKEQNKGREVSNLWSQESEKVTQEIKNRQIPLELAYLFMEADGRNEAWMDSIFGDSLWKKDYLCLPLRPEIFKLKNTIVSCSNGEFAYKDSSFLYNVFYITDSFNYSLIK